MSILKYSPHIDGLRAIAVLSVIIFHMNSHWMPGGFVGVDVFFVISGYLITSIINKQLGEKSFSLLEFYNRRTKRILPALYLMVFITIIIGYLTLLPNHFSSLRQSAGTTYLFISNMYFANAGDYFSPKSELWPLLHTWSLGVEEQFYIIWPTLLSILLLKFTLSNKLLLILTSSIILFIVGSYIHITISQDLTSSFYYLMPARFGEMLIGAALALFVSLHSEKIKGHSLLTLNLLSLIGALLLAISFFFITKENMFPGVIVLLPCIGTALLIYSGLSQKENVIVIKILQLKPIVFIGLLSYSLYLWHWPILAFLRYITLEIDLNSSSLIIATVLIICTSYLSWRFVETPFRVNNWSLKKSLTYLYLMPFAMTVLLLTAIHIIDSGKTYQIRDMDLLSYKLPSSDKQKCKVEKKLIHCSFGGDKAIHALVLGDSHAAHLINYFNEISKETDINFNFLSSPECPALENYSTDGMFMHSIREKACAKLIEKMKTEIEESDHIIFALRWNMYLDMTTNHKLLKINPGFEDQLTQAALSLVNQGKTVYFVNKLPEYTNSVLQQYASILEFPNPIADSGITTNSILNKIANTSKDIHIIDIHSTASQWENGIKDDMPMYRDWNHLNRYGALTLAADSLKNGDFSRLSK